MTTREVALGTIALKSDLSTSDEEVASGMEHRDLHGGRCWAAAAVRLGFGLAVFAVAAWGGAMLWAPNSSTVNIGAAIELPGVQEGLGVCHPNKHNKRKLYGIVRMHRNQCTAMDGQWNGDPQGWMDCHFYWCEIQDAAYFPAKVGSCPDHKKGYGMIWSQGGKCRQIGGAMNGNPATNTWTDCHVDFCERNPSMKGALVVKPVSTQGCPLYGVMCTPRNLCSNFGGRWSAWENWAAWVGCNLQYCNYPKKKKAVSEITGKWQLRGQVSNTKKTVCTEVSNTVSTSEMNEFSKSWKMSLGVSAEYESNVGVQFGRIGVGRSLRVAVDMSVENSWSSKYQRQIAQSRTTTQKTCVVTNPPNEGKDGNIVQWRWVFDIVYGGESVTIETDTVAYTQNIISAPKCYPNESKDGRLYQICARYLDPNYKPPAEKPPTCKNEWFWCSERWCYISWVKKGCKKSCGCK